MPGIAALAQALNSTLGAIWGEWHRLHDCPPACITWDGFVANVARMSEQTFIHPDLVGDARLFGNHWTI